MNTMQEIREASLDKVNALIERIRKFGFDVTLEAFDLKSVSPKRGSFALSVDISFDKLEQHNLAETTYQSIVDVIAGFEDIELGEHNFGRRFGTNTIKNYSLSIKIQPAIEQDSSKKSRFGNSRP